MRKNPFDSALHRSNSNYCLSVQRELMHSPGGLAQARLTLEVFEELQAKIVDEQFPCVLAQAAFRQESYRFGVYAPLGSREATAGLARDLYTFVQERQRREHEFASFLAVFDAPTELPEVEFERLLWLQLERLAELDREHHPWDPAVSDDPGSPNFGFSFATTAFFVVGMHADASRLSRRFPYPMLVFNPHDQFELLREEGRFERVRDLIRSRDRALQGSVNPMVDDFGRTSEARQYSGREVGAEWRCPFHSRAKAGT